MRIRFVAPFALACALASAAISSCSNSSSAVGDTTDASDASEDAPANDTGAGDASSITTSCVPDAGSSTSVPRIDEMETYAAIAASRPDLLAYPPDGDGGTGSLCYQTMMMRPEFRNVLLDAGSIALPSSIEKDTDAETTADETWMSAQQADEVAFCGSNAGGGCTAICANAASCAACPSGSIGVSGAPLGAYYVSGYALCAFVGYKLGPNVSIYDANGLVWLVYFTFASPDTDLTAARMHAYADALACAGFQGDFKILTDPRLPQQERFQYNDVIVHGHSQHDAEIAEAIGLALFTSGGNSLLSATGRGLDVLAYGTWAEFLCAEHSDASSLQSQNTHAIPFTQYAE